MITGLIRWDLGASFCNIAWAWILYASSMENDIFGAILQMNLVLVIRYQTLERCSFFSHLPYLFIMSFPWLKLST